MMLIDFSGTNIASVNVTRQESVQNLKKANHPKEWDAKPLA